MDSEYNRDSYLKGSILLTFFSGYTNAKSKTYKKEKRRKLQRLF